MQQLTKEKLQKSIFFTEQEKQVLYEKILRDPQEEQKFLIFQDTYEKKFFLFENFVEGSVFLPEAWKQTIKEIGRKNLFLLDEMMEFFIQEKEAIVASIQKYATKTGELLNQYIQHIFALQKQKRQTVFKKKKQALDDVTSASLNDQADADNLLQNV